jgi:hypothetical protein
VATDVDGCLDRSRHVDDAGGQRQHGVINCGTADFVADLGGSGVVEQ